jgi:hypothetical protein
MKLGLCLNSIRTRFLCCHPLLEEMEMMMRWMMGKMKMSLMRTWIETIKGARVNKPKKIRISRLLVLEGLGAELKIFMLLIRRLS